MLKDKLTELGFKYTGTDFSKSQIWKQEKGEVRVHYHPLSDNISHAYTLTPKERILNIQISDITIDNLEDKLLTNPHYVNGERWFS